MEPLLIALLGGAVGAVVTTWMRIRYEREEQFRDRQISAAHDFLKTAAEAIVQVRELDDAVDEHGLRDQDGELLAPVLEPRCGREVGLTSPPPRLDSFNCCSVTIQRLES